MSGDARKRFSAAMNPRWASYTLDRNTGTDITFVWSWILDGWTDAQVDVMERRRGGLTKFILLKYERGR
jgi:hypothetical protein